MKIYLDNIAFSLQKAGGISVYFTELIGRMLSNKLDVEFIEHKKARFNIFRNMLSLPPGNIRNEAFFPLTLIRYLPVRITDTNNNHAIFHSSYYRTCKNKNIRNVITVYDFTYEYFGSGLSKYVHDRQKRDAVNKADGIICISENTKNDLLKLCGNIDSNKIKVIYLAASDEFHKLNDNDIINLKDIIADINKINYVLFVGSREYHKNFDVAISSVKRLDGYRLVIVGGKPLSKSELQVLENELPGRYLYLGKVDNRLLNILYNFAFCLLYPSTYEGFGIPILEAMQAGCPVVTTNKSSIPEVCGEAGLMADSICSDELSRLMRLLETDSFREERIKLGFEQANKFSWDKTYRDTVDFYAQLF